MRWIVVLAAVTAGLAAAPAAHAQAPPPCPAPSLEGFQPPPDVRDPSPALHFRAGRPGELRILTRDAIAVDLAWGDGERERVPVRENVARAVHTYARARGVQIVATAISSCGAGGTPGGLTLDVRRPCERSRGGDLREPDCDAVTGALTVSANGLWTPGTYLSFPCRDTGVGPETRPPEPVARAAACAGTDAPTPVDGLLPVRPGGALTITLGAPARGVSVALASADESRGRLRPARRAGRSGRRWRVRLPASLGTRNRLVIRARRAGFVDDWLAGIRPAR